VTAIDLEARAPTVQQMDFFDYPIDKTTKASFDVIVLGLVINFVPTAEKRGISFASCVSMNLHPYVTCFEAGVICGLSSRL